MAPRHPFDVRVHLKKTHRLSNLLTLQDYPKSKVTYEVWGTRKAKVTGLHTPPQFISFSIDKQ
jgi:hypothetical protein